MITAGHIPVDGVTPITAATGKDTGMAIMMVTTIDITTIVMIITPIITVNVAQEV